MGEAGHREKGFSSAGVGVVLSLSNSRLGKELNRDDKVARKEKWSSHEKDRETTGETMRAPRTAERRAGWTTRSFT